MRSEVCWQYLVWSYNCLDIQAYCSMSVLPWSQARAVGVFPCYYFYHQGDKDFVIIQLVEHMGTLMPSVRHCAGLFWHKIMNVPYHPRYSSTIGSISSVMHWWFSSLHHKTSMTCNIQHRPHILSSSTCNWTPNIISEFFQSSAAGSWV